MQVKLSPENVEPMLQQGKFKVSYRSENQIVAFKPSNYGKIHMRLRRVKSRYSLEDRFWWVGNFHFEKGLSPQCFFDSQEVQEFAKNYVFSFVKSK